MIVITGYSEYLKQIAKALIDQEISFSYDSVKYALKVKDTFYPEDKKVFLDYITEKYPNLTVTQTKK